MWIGILDYGQSNIQPLKSDILRWPVCSCIYVYNMQYIILRVKNIFSDQKYTDNLTNKNRTTGIEYITFGFDLYVKWKYLLSRHDRFIYYIIFNKSSLDRRGSLKRERT